MIDHLNHIHQQCKQREITIALQRFKNLVTKTGQKRYEVNSYNERLFLTNADILPVGTRIISDSNSLEISANQQAMEALEEFSGLVSVELPANSNATPVLEFIQILSA